MEWIWGGVAAKRIVYIYIDPGSSLFLADWQFFRGEGGAVGLLAVSPIGLIWTRRPHARRNGDRPWCDRRLTLRRQVQVGKRPDGWGLGSTLGRRGWSRKDGRKAILRCELDRSRLLCPNRNVHQFPWTATRFPVCAIGKCILHGTWPNFRFRLDREPGIAPAPTGGAMEFSSNIQEIHLPQGVSVYTVSI